MAIRKFQHGQSTYNCRVCKRLTRNTGDEGQVELCAECYELAGIKNEISDNGPLGPDSFTKPETVVKLLGRLKAYGIDLTKTWGEAFAEFIPKVK